MFVKESDKMLKRIISPVVSVWNDFLHWWNAIPQEVMSTKLMHHYEVTRFLMSTVSFIAFIGIPYSYIISAHVQGNVWNTIILINIVAVFSFVYSIAINGKLSNPFRKRRGFTALIVVNKFLFFGCMLYVAANSSGRNSAAPVPDILLCLYLWSLLYCYSKVIQWLIKLSVNKDIVWPETAIDNTKYFKLDSVWRQYNQMTRPDRDMYPVGISQEEKDEFDKELHRYPESVNTNEYIARNAGLPNQLVKQAKELDQVGAYSLPNVQLETPWPLRYQFKVPVNYYMQGTVIVPKKR